MTSWITHTSRKPGATFVTRFCNRGGRAASATKRLSRSALGATGLACAMAVAAGLTAAAAADTRPLSAAQITLFETPHLRNISHPETLEYRFQREGTGGFTDSIAERIERIHADGTKYVEFDFLTGPHRVAFPAIDNFHGNPLLMLFLEHDVREMQAATGIAAGYFRHGIREALVGRAQVSADAVAIDGKSVPAKRITLRPFLDDEHLARLPAIRGKTYTFVIADRVPGMIDELSAAEAPDPETGAGKVVERITFVGEKPVMEKP